MRENPEKFDFQHNKPDNGPQPNKCKVPLSTRRNEKPSTRKLRCISAFPVELGYINYV